MSWGNMRFVDEQGIEIDLDIDSYKSKESNQFLKWYDENTYKYITYEAAAK